MACTQNSKHSFHDIIFFFDEDENALTNLMLQNWMKESHKQPQQNYKYADPENY